MSDSGSADDEMVTEVTEVPDGRGPASRVLVAAVVVVSLLLLGTGAAGWWRAHDITSQDPADNRALYDVSGTSEVEGVVSTGLTRILSYDYENPDATRAAADELLRGEARAQFDDLYATLVDLAPDQQLTMDARVSAVSVQELSDDAGRLLVFLDQSTRRGTDGDVNVGAAQVAVGVHREDGAWRVVDLDIR